MIFDEAFAIVHEYSRLSRERCRSLWDAAQACDRNGVPGALVECGTASGGSALLLGWAAPTRRLVLYDSFQGMPPATENDPPAALKETGHCACGLETVHGVLQAHGLATRTHFVKGWYKDTLHCNHPGPIAVLHVDCDWYESVKAVLAAFYDAVAVGGYVQIDDYGHWAGCRKAVDEFFAGRGENPCLVELDYTGRRHRKVKP